VVITKQETISLYISFKNVLHNLSFFLSGFVCDS
jgi:hypothetical protein